MSGLPAETIAFLADLAEHNDRRWFDANRDRYARDWLAPARELVAQLAPTVAELAPGLVADPRVDASILRLHRDARFVRDGRPFKDYLHLWFWEGDRAEAVSGLHLRVTPTTVSVGAGATRLDPARLRRFRDLVLAPKAGAELVAAVAEAEGGGATVRGDTLRRGPKGLATDDPARQRLLRHRTLWSAVEASHPGVLSSQRFVRWCARRWAPQLELHRWLTDRLGPHRDE